jgi:hypothetical protein
MKIYLFIICFFLTNLSYSSSSTYQIIDSVTVDTSGCKYHYPVLVSEAPDSCVQKVNRVLKEFSKGHKVKYKILFYSDSLICFEFIGRLSHHENVYNSICIDPISSEFVLPIPFLDVNKLHPFVKKFYKEDASEDYGSKAYYYGGGGGATLLYGITKNKLVLYMGGEGEQYGYDRLEIPLEKLHCGIYKMNKEQILNFYSKSKHEIYQNNHFCYLCE